MNDQERRAQAERMRREQEAAAEAQRRRTQEENDRRRREEADRREREKQEAYNQEMRRREQDREREKLKEKARSGSCFVGTTPVLTPDGWRPMSELGKDDQVVSYDKSSGATTIRHVKERKHHKSAVIWEVCLTHGKEPICTTRFHSFLTNRGWKRTNQLRSGDILISVGREKIVVASIVKTNRVEPVFNLITEGEHTFIVQGCVVHNFTYLRSLRIWWHEHIWRNESFEAENYTEVSG